MSEIKDALADISRRTGERARAAQRTPPNLIRQDVHDLLNRLRPIFQEEAASCERWLRRRERVFYRRAKRLQRDTGLTDEMFDEYIMGSLRDEAAAYRFGLFASPPLQGDPHDS